MLRPLKPFTPFDLDLDFDFDLDGSFRGYILDGSFSVTLTRLLIKNRLTKMCG